MFKKYLTMELVVTQVLEIQQRIQASHQMVRAHHRQLAEYQNCPTVTAADKVVAHCEVIHATNEHMNHYLFATKMIAASFKMLRPAANDSKHLDGLPA